jgi:glucose-1-phosphate thymidylyltransferase
MKGIILAGGTGSRLFPLTKVTNKHLLPVYDKPMIYYPLEALVGAGVKEVLVVTGGGSAGDFMRLLGNGSEFGLTGLYFAYQQGEGGIADALRLAQDFAAGRPICVLLGDNIVERTIRPYVERFKKSAEGAMLLFNKVPDPQRFGVPVFEGGKLVRIEEKPKVPRSDYAVTGIYCYDNLVFEIINSLKPSDRGEFEITDVNNAYLERGRLAWAELDGWWTDAGTFESLRSAANLVAQYGANNP